MARLNTAWVDTLNIKLAKSCVGRWFRLDGSGHKKSRAGSVFTTEIRAGLATFFAMAYIIAVNANIVADTGGTCVATNGGGYDDTEYMLCVAEVKRDLITATASISALASFGMGLFANLPVGLAPGLGLNAYFTYTVVGFHGSGRIPYEVALTAIFVEGWIFFALAVLGLRQWLARAIPKSIKLAISVGIGLFLTLIGLTYSEGIGLITGAADTPLTLAGCYDYQQNQVTKLCPSGAKMRSARLWVGVFCGGIFTTFLMMYRVKGAILFGILLVSIISWPRTTDATYFPRDNAVGDSMFDFFKQVIAFHKIEKTLNVQDWSIGEYGGQFGLALITFLYVDIMDCTGTLYSMAQYANLINPVTQDFEGSTVAYMVDSVAISIGALLGTPPVTAFIESGAGIREGGKTGLTSITTGACFFISIFFAPIFASIPPWATGCVLILIGCMMATSVIQINWHYLGDAVPAFVTMALIPFTYSIADGLIAGISTYIVINTIVWVLEKVTGGRIVPPNKDQKEGWSYKIPGGVLPPWLTRMAKGKRDFWREDVQGEVSVHEMSRSSGSLRNGRGDKPEPVCHSDEEKQKL